MKIYLDACCLNRPFDNQTLPHIRLESEAVLIILGYCRSGKWKMIGSDTLDYEISRIPDESRQQGVSFLYAFCKVKSLVNQDVEQRAAQLVNLGIGAMDALHLACAEAAEADAMLTTANELLRKAAKKEAGARIRVANPLIWLAEVTNNESRSNDSQ